ncbi:transposase, partial [Lactobacillus delbrueckii]|uniref:transposase n=1 Tax=Lactobacillus delbrueckii TaxID=1584 RepID=UPI0022AF3EDA
MIDILQRLYQNCTPLLKYRHDTTLEEIIDICKATKNSHFIWFARLLYRHLRGIYTFAKYGISTGKLEGINNKI